MTGGTGYVGMKVVEEMQAAGREVRVIDVILHGQEDLAAEQRQAGVDLVVADIRDDDARRRALEGVDEVVHLAAIVGDPACALDPERSQDVNVSATRSLLADALAAGVEKLVFASTCSNYGRMEDPTVPITEDGVLAPGVAVRGAEGRHGAGDPERRVLASCSRPACASRPSTAPRRGCAST